MRTKTTLSCGTAPGINGRTVRMHAAAYQRRSISLRFFPVSLSRRNSVVSLLLSTRQFIGAEGQLQLSVVSSSRNMNLLRRISLSAR